jgi:DNA primase
MSVIDEVKERLDVVDVISNYVLLKKAGRNYKGICPFHSEKTPSFVVFPDTQSWHCFGACGTGGDVFAFLMRQENVDFSEALAVLAQRAGVELKPPTEKQKDEEDLRARLMTIHNVAAMYFHNRLLTSPDAEAARDYLARRGLNRETIDRFQLGFAPDEWHDLGSYLTTKGYKESDLLSSGLVIAREGGSGHYDRFRNRVIIPICDHTGRPIGFGGRVLDHSEPKYLNSPETPIFEKGHVLFGLSLAKSTIRAEDATIVVEGYMDVIQAHQHNNTNVVASMGTALTEDQIKTLRRYARTIILALDPDTAGGRATLRGLDLSRQITLHELISIGPDIVSEIQRSSEADVRIAILPPGKDPDDVIRETPEAWPQLIQKALPVIDYYFELMEGRFDLDSARGKAEAADHFLAVLKDLENPIQRAHYIQKLSRLIRVDEKILVEQLRGFKKHRIGKTEAWQTTQDIDSKGRPLEVEEHCLMLILQRPGVLSVADQLLLDLGMSPLGDSDFSTVENREIFLTVQKLISQSTELNIETLQASLSNSLDEYLARLWSRWRGLPPIAEDLIDSESIKSILKVRQRVIGKWLNELHSLQSDAESEHDVTTAESYRRLVTAHARDKSLLQQLIQSKNLVNRLASATQYGFITTSDN